MPQKGPTVIKDSLPHTKNINIFQIVANNYDVNVFINQKQKQWFQRGSFYFIQVSEKMSFKGN